MAKPSKALVAVQAINQYLKANQLTSGDKLPTEPELMALCGVGRSAVREAIQQLAFNGVVTVKQGSGTYVNQPVEIQVNNPLLRRTVKMIEYEVVDELIDQEIDPDEWVRLRACLARRNQLLKQEQFTAFVDSDVAFHTQMVDAANNQFLSKWYRELIPLWKQHLNDVIKRTTAWDTNIKYHDQLFDALINRNRQLAIEMIERVGNQTSREESN